MNISGMTYNDLKAGYEALMVSINEQMEKCREYQRAMAIKRTDEVKEALRILMDSYGLSKDEMKSYLDGEDSINPITSVEVVENPQIEDEVLLALPEPSKEDEVDTEVSINQESQEETVDSKTAMVETEDELPTLESLLSDDPEYKAFYHPVIPVKKNSRALPTLDELLSGEPINRILCLGNLEPKGTAYRQNTRICHPDGIIPTETASGQTLIYIPPAPSMVA